MSSRVTTTYCRICEALCGLEVEVEGHGHEERIVDVRPDRQHPVSKGFACVKGVGLGGLHHDPDRLNYPMKRVGDRFERISWEQALAEIGGKLRALRREHGARALAVYTGNPTFFNFKSFFFSEQLIDALGTPNLFASHSLDCNNKFHVAQQMYGLSTVHPIVDLAHTRFLLMLGSNPAASQMSFIQAPNALQRLKQIVRRGGRVVIVDPRRTETAAQVGEHLSIRPGTDAYLLIAMLQVVIAEGLVKPERIARFMRGYERVRDVVAGWTPERVAHVTGIAADTIRALARDYATTDGAAVYMSTGVNMGPFGSIAYWLLQCLNLVTGNVDRRGGLLQPKGPFDLLRLTSMLGLGKRGRSTRDGRFGGVVDALPAGALASEIVRPGKDRIRALIVTAGNPLHSVPGGHMQAALAELELCVCIDIYPSETSRHAHYLLPATDMLERSDYPITTSLNQETPVAQFTERVVKPLFERREEWEVFCELALGASERWSRPTLCHVFGLTNRLLARLGSARKLDPELLLAALFRLLGDIRLDELRASPHGRLLPPVEPDSFLGKRVHTPDRLVNLAPDDVLADLARLTRALGSFEPVSGRLVAIGRREKRSHNSWMHNHPGLDTPHSNTVLLHPQDAEQRALKSGDRVLLRGNGRLLELPVEITAQVRQGVIVVPHGWGHSAHGGRKARGLGGGNINELLPGGEAQLEPVSGQAIMLGHALEVTKLGERADSSGPGSS